MTMEPRFAAHRTFPGPLYIVTRDWGKLGFESVTDPSDTRATIIRDIKDRQIDRVVSVIEVYEGRATDITDDICNAVGEEPTRAALADVRTYMSAAE